MPWDWQIGGWIVQAFDIFVVAAIFYSLLMLARGTRAWKIFSGLAVFAGIYLLSDLLNFRTLNWLLRQVIPLAPVALVILFFPELRYALEEMGRVQFWRHRMLRIPQEHMHRVIDHVVSAADSLSGKRIGALMVMERDEGLDDIIRSGTPLHADVSAELLSTVFYPGSALHDGAVIIRGNKIVAAGVVLPLSDRPGIGSDIHTRHRAALGVTERSDALSVVVSEETGAISLGAEGRLVRGLKPDVLRQRLLAALSPTEDPRPRRPSLRWLASLPGRRKQ